MRLNPSHLRTLVAALAVWAVSAGAVAQTASPLRVAPGLRLEFHDDGTMSLSASGVSTREIFMEWARQCGCYVVNADRLSSVVLATPLEFTRVAERRVLESLLRQATGYVLTPRRAGRTGASSYETVYIVASSQASAPAVSPFPMYTPPPVPLPTLGAPDDEVPPLAPVPPDGSQPRPGAPADPPQQPAAPSPPSRTASPGVSVPMVIVPITPVPSPATRPGG